MKNTEAIDESVESSGPVLAAAESAGAADPSMLDQRRRRLVRGAAAFAPLVLTLRSGALAAASCTGAKVVTVTFDPITGAIQQTGVAVGDICVEADICDTTGKVKPPSGIPDFGKVEQFEVKTFRRQKTLYLRCTNKENLNGNIAILSATPNGAASSFGINLP